MREANSRIYFVTQNRGKFEEAARIADRFGVELRHLKLEKHEIQARKLTEIAAYAARHAAEATNRTVVADDSGFFVLSLNGFPGPYSSQVFETIGLEGILKLMRNTRNRDASFQAAIAYCKPGHHPICFTGSVRGRVLYRRRGTHGFGYDPLFVPSGGDGRTFAEMSTDEKNLYSHRARAFAKFCRWLRERER